MSLDSVRNPVELQRSKISEVSHRLGFSDATLEYLELKGGATSNPILLIPGFTEGKVSLHGFASQLCSQGDTTVLLPDQYQRRDKKILSPGHAVRNQAEYLLAVIAERKLQHTPLDVIAHSFGTIIFDAMSKMAAERGWTCFQSELGAGAVFIAPAGSNPKESRHGLGRRFGIFVATESKIGWDPDALKAGPQNVKSDPLKYAGEALAVSSPQNLIDYSQLAANGVRPHIVVYSNESVYPHELISDTIGVALEAGDIESYSSPLDSRTDGIGLLGVLSLRQLIDGGMPKNEAKAAWQHSNAGAEHNRFMIVPEVDAATALALLRQRR